MINRLLKHIFPILVLCIVLILTGCDRIGMFGIAIGNILILHVSSTGDDTTGDGSIESPYLTIQKALSEISGDNAQIQVATGTYSMTEPVMLKPGISLLGGYDPTTWERNSYTTDIDRSTYQTLLTYSGSYDGTNYMDPSRVIECSDSDMDNSTIIEGFTIEGENSDACPCGIFVTGGAAPTVRFNSIYAGSSSGSFQFAVVIYDTSGVKLTNNLLNHGTGTPGGTCSTIVTYDASCTIDGNSLTSLPGKRCMFLYGSGNITVTDNTLTSSYEGIRIDSNAITATVTGNTLNADSGSVIGIYCSAQKVIMNGNTTNHSGSTYDGNDAIRINNCELAELEGNIVTGGTSTGYNSGITIYGSGTTIIQDNDINAGTSATGTHRGLSIGSSGTTKILRNKICVNPDPGSDKTGIYLSSTSGSIIIASNYIDGSGSITSYGIKCYNASPDIINNTIIGGDGGTDSYGIYLDMASTPRIINNIISSNAGTYGFAFFDVDDPSMPSELKNNCLTNCDEIYEHYGTLLGTITALHSYQTFFSDNLVNDIVAIDAIDGSIADGSAAIDSLGLNISSLFPDAMTDMTGKTRDVPITIGAYEY